MSDSREGVFVSNFDALGKRESGSRDGMVKAAGGRGMERGTPTERDLVRQQAVIVEILPWIRGLAHAAVPEKVRNEAPQLISVVNMDPAVADFKSINLHMPVLPELDQINCVINVLLEIEVVQGKGS
ncbi:hypothetical protein BC834DRAFT_843864 [Gloeopeniophorella convolvens]|nr:hypothetical protein BC834DRAFT_843864 [Gloeopeniophorella convolvens]